jgi:hypothetical protein
MSKNLKGDFHSLYPDMNGDVLVSYREAEGKPFGLYAYDFENSTPEELVYTNDEFHIIEPVMVEIRPVPLKLPAIVDETKEKGTLLCLNTDLSMDSVTHSEKADRKTKKVQIFGLEGMLGELLVEEDGSFYIEIDADTPVRFQTLDANGEILRGPSSWIWVRPNEKRSCMGCHEDRELAPENKVPDALYAGIVKLPEGERAEAIILNEILEGNEE